MPVEPLPPRLRAALDRFADWLDAYGETSQDHQDFYAGKLGRAAKALYYRQPTLGKMAVAPMVLCEAFFPSTRKFFYPRMRLPIADAHYAMGYSLLFRATGNERHRQKAIHFLEVLKQTRCPAFKDYAWGYPFDWQTRGGILAQGTPLITTEPYCYEAFDYVSQIDTRPEWVEIKRSLANHALRDYQDFPVGPNSATCTYTPTGGQGVVNASAYRAFLLAGARRDFGDESFWKVAERNLNFVLECQQPDGSWPYAMDGTRDFVDHFHTCFVLKGLAKVEALTGHRGCTAAIERGVAYYVANLFDEAGLPKPFSKAPRLTVYRRELYDCAECLNLGFLLKGRFPELDKRVAQTVDDILKNWITSAGSFRSRMLLVGWDNVPMHRWGQSEMFRSLCLLLAGADGFDPLFPKGRVS